ncbi:MAG: carnitinyl-CoA dehydratase [Actinobacteria bacterium]|nr:carnitinyl-CoA dehydratase [Actinomycetota bacterium]
MAIHYRPDGDHVVVITIDRPEARNSADAAHFRDLRAAWERFAADDDARVAIVTGVGDTFFTGADLKRYMPEVQALRRAMAETGADAVDGCRPDDAFAAVLRGVPLYKPVVAAVNGFCVGAGMEMLGGIDLRLACPEASFAVMEPKRGIIASGGTTVRLPRQIPWALAMEMLLCADLVPASRALEMGLLNAVVPRNDLMGAAREYAGRIAVNAPLSVRGTKESALRALYADVEQVARVREAAASLVRLIETVRPEDPGSTRFALAVAAEVLEGLGRDLQSGFDIESSVSAWVVASDDAREGPAAFAEKRPPQWHNR